MSRSWYAGYLARRVLLVVPLALVISLVVFLLTQIVPGGPVAALVGNHPMTASEIAEIRHKYGLDLPVMTQYFHWLREALLHFDLGRSILTSETVTASIREHLGVSLLLNGGGVVTSLLIGVPMGIVAALRRGRILDRVLVSFAMLFGSSPAFVVAIGALYLFGVRLGWFPLFGAGSGVGDRFHHLLLPALILGIGGSAFVMRITRAAMLNEFEQDYVAFARARGVSPLRIVGRYALRNSLIPVLTAAGLLLVHLLTAGVFVEEVFGLPGIGSLLVSSVQGADIPVVQGLVLLFAVWIIVLNLCVDVVYVLIDPRVGFDRARG